MSTVISYDKKDASETLSDIILCAMARETISQYIRRIKHEKNLTLKQIEYNSKGEISGGYVHDLIKEKADNPSIDKLVALAKGLGRPEDEVIAVARGGNKPSDDKEFQQSLYFMLYEKAKNASPEKKAFILKVLEMIDRELEEGVSATR